MLKHQPESPVRQGLAKFFCKRLIGNIFSFAGHTVSATAILPIVAGEQTQRICKQTGVAGFQNLQKPVSAGFDTGDCGLPILC